MGMPKANDHSFSPSDLWQLGTVGTNQTKPELLQVLPRAQTVPPTKGCERAGAASSFRRNPRF